MKIPVIVVPADPAMVEAAPFAREAQILRTVAKQVWALNPAYSPEGAAACEPVLAGAVASLRACGSQLVPPRPYTVADENRRESDYWASIGGHPAPSVWPEGGDDEGGEAA